VGAEQLNIQGELGVVPVRPLCVVVVTPPSVYTLVWVGELGGPSSTAFVVTVVRESASLRHLAAAESHRGSSSDDGQAEHHADSDKTDDDFLLNVLHS